ncbi:hypothetical protein [Paenibacillus periandrae]|uniref:hypothetical protein n=1 Tax=Paenibacillus periandrae TaxID=1761741 RepID=UPI001F08DA70|nr:hypothetical protein [Paenibacillus periandrae]
MKELSPFLAKSGVSFVKNQLYPNDIVVEETDNGIVLVSTDLNLTKTQTSVYVIPRDYDKPKQNAMIHEDDYKTINEFFAKNKSVHNYVLVVHAERDGLRYLNNVGYYILIPNEVLHTIFILQNKTNLNIGVTPTQREKWSPKGITYYPIKINPWHIRESLLDQTELPNGWYDFHLQFSEKEARVLSKFGIPNPCMFSLNSSSSEDGEHYIGIGEYGSFAFRQYGVWISVKSGSGQVTLNAFSVNNKGKCEMVNWPEIKIKCKKNDSLIHFTLVRAIEAGWLTSSNPLHKEDLEASTPPSEPFDWDFDGQAMGSYRKEQSKLRELLLQGQKEGCCVICGEMYPADMLWAAHIKKRSECQPEEKRDLLNIAALMCKLGCDDLFEKGYIGINQGIVTPIRSTTASALQFKILELDGKKCAGFNDRNTKYFDWHWDFYSSARYGHKI